MNDLCLNLIPSERFECHRSYSDSAHLSFIFSGLFALGLIIRGVSSAEGISAM